MKNHFIIWSFFFHWIKWDTLQRHDNTDCIALIQICWQALKPSLKANLTHGWLFYKHLAKISIIFFIFILYKIHLCTENCLARCTSTDAHTHTCKETLWLSLAHLQHHLYKHIRAHTLISIMHKYSFTLQQRLSSHHFLCFPFLLIVNIVNSGSHAVSFKMFHHYHLFLGALLYTV